MPNEKLMNEIIEGLDKLAEKFERGNKPMTNGDRIRAMTDEELGKLLFDLGYEAYRYALRPTLKPIAETQEEWIEWLKQPEGLYT